MNNCSLLKIPNRLNLVCINQVHSIIRKKVFILNTSSLRVDDFFREKLCSFFLSKPNRFFLWNGKTENIKICKNWLKMYESVREKKLNTEDNFIEKCLLEDSQDE